MQQMPTPAGRARRTARRVLAALGVVLAVVLLPGTPATAATGDDVDVQVQCVWDNGDGTMTAVWNYVNHTAAAIDVPVGADNRLTTQPQDQGQPTHFLPGEHLNAWVVTFAGTSLAWHVLTNGDTANRGSRACASHPVSVVGSWRAAVIGVSALAPVGWLLLRRTRLRHALALPASRTTDRP
jgi:hypothetical protein